MLFNSIRFLIFIAFFFPLYYLTKGRARRVVSLGGSYIFYGAWDYRFLFLIIGLTFVNYFCAHQICCSKTPKKKSVYLFISVAFSLGVLAVFKYFNFFILNISSLLNVIGLGNSISSFNIILPVGISFYTFQTMSYTIDVYNKKIPEERSLLNFATFVAFFPQLVAGPIVRASCFLPQAVEQSALDDEDFIKGFQMIIWGYFLKICLADSLALVVDVRFASPVNHNSLSLLIGVIFYAFQIYGDFAGYSLIAIGIARLLGYKFPKNFDKPYFAGNVTEFWQRWHISLSTWLKDYLYIPLGGNRYGRIRMYRNLLITMLLGGLWHGASWNFVIWGGLHGILLVIHKAWTHIKTERKWSLPVHRILRAPLEIITIVFTFALVCITWIFFRSSNFETSILIMEKLFQTDNYSFSAVTQKFHVIKGILLILIVVAAEFLDLYVYSERLLIKRPLLSSAGLAAVLVLIAFLGTFGSNSFIYFQF